METLWRNLKQGARILRKKRGATFVMILSIAFGIGTSTAIFSIVQGILLNPLPFHKPSELVMVYESNPAEGYPQFSTSPLNYLDWKKQNQVFQDMAAFASDSFSLSGNGEPERVEGVSIRAELIGLLGVSPALGRGFRSEEMEPGKNEVVILTDGLWTRRFGKDPHIVGKSIQIDGLKSTVIGVLPQRFEFISEQTEILTPLVFDADAFRSRGAKWLGVVARLKPGVTISQAQRNMDTVARGLAATYPEKNKGWGILLQDLQESVVGEIQKPVLILFASVLVVLIIACANVAGLLLAGNSARKQEIAVRIALGAKRKHLIHQLLTESLLISITGGFLGVIFSVWSRDTLLYWAEKFLPRVNEISINMQVLGFALLLSFVSGILFGLIPALFLTRPNDAIPAHSRSFTRGGPRSVFVIGEVALAVLLLSGAGLLVRSLHRLMDVPPGFDPKNVLRFTIQNPESRYPERPMVAAFHHSLLERLETISGVHDAAAVSVLPLTGQDWSLSFDIKGHELPEADQPSSEYRVVSSDFFRTMKIPLKSGRFFTDHDRGDTQLVSIINEAFQKRFFAHEDPIGRQIRIGDSVKDLRQIVGVVGSVKDFGLRSENVPVMYVALSQKPLRYMTYVIRTTEKPEKLIPAVKQIIHSMDRDMPIFDLGTMDSILSGSVNRQKFITYLLSFFSIAALCLALFGLYGLLSYSVAQRTQEIGVRMALGAESFDVLRLILSSGARLVIAGLLLGLATAIAVTRVLENFLFQIKPTDPLTLLLVIFSLTVVALLAMMFPARRAANLSPLQALRYE
jgi:putative ABC transport system permease protein